MDNFLFLGRSIIYLEFITSYIFGVKILFYKMIVMVHEICFIFCKHSSLTKLKTSTSMSNTLIFKFPNFNGSWNLEIWKTTALAYILFGEDKPQLNFLFFSTTEGYKILRIVLKKKKKKELFWLQEMIMD